MHATDSGEPTAICDALASANRRHVLRSLATGGDDVVSVADLVDDLVDRDGTADDRRRLGIQLHHVALPKLAAAGFVEYDARSLTARARAHPPAALRALVSDVEDARWSG